MKQFYLLFFFLLQLISFRSISQSNASINILTQNSGIVFNGGVGYVQVDIGNNGPASPIGVNKVRAQISVPSIAQVLPNIEQDGLPAGWIILTNNGSVIQICNGTDIIPVNAARTILIKVKGITLGGPSTVVGVLSFGPGTGVCTGPGSLPGDVTADNTSTSSITVITPPSCNLSVSATAGTISCNGGTTTLTATPTGGNGVVEYNLNGGTFQTSNIFTVNAGTYTVNAREVLNPSCSSSVNVTISEPAALSAPIVGTITQPTCTIASGSVQLQNLPAGNWTIQAPFNISGSTSTTTITGLASGSYNFTVSNAAGCISAPSASAVINTQPASPNVPVLNITQPNCTVSTGIILSSTSTIGLMYSFDGAPYVSFPVGGFIANTGNHTLTAMNSDGCISAIANITIDPQPATPFTPVVSNIVQPTCSVSTGSVQLTGLPSGNWTIQPGNISGNTSSTIVSGLSAGDYNFTVTNSNSCTSAATTTVTITNNITAPASPVVVVTQPTCSTATGLLTVTSATTPAILFSLDNGTFGIYPVGGYVLNPGNHTLVLKDISGCTSNPVLITINPQPPTPSLPLAIITQPNCNTATGNVSLTSVTAGLLFSLDNGIYQSYPVNGYNLNSGTHTLSAQNSDGCFSPVLNIIINAQPPSPNINVNAQNINCNGGTGTLTASAAGGTSPYTYSLNAGVYQVNNQFTVGAGVYSISVKDVNGCTATSSSVTLTEPALLTSNFTIDSIVCSGNTGNINVITNGGTTPYQYSFDGGIYQNVSSYQVIAGNHQYQVKDANGCLSALTNVVVTQPTEISVSITANRITTCGGKAEVTITATGGTLPYVSGTGVVYKGPGTWNFSVTDSKGCTGNATVNIEAPGCMILIPFPNPANNVVNVYHSTAKPNALIYIYDMMGRIMKKLSVPERSFQSRIDISNLAIGNYILQFINNGEKKQIMFNKGSH